MILSFDVEEFDIPTEYGMKLDLSAQLEVGTRGLDEVAKLLDQLQVPATLFITATIAQHVPDQFKALAARHEIASHGLTHSGFEESHLARSRTILRGITGRNVIGFRMARMAKVSQRAIRDAGYLYNSSENPIWLPGRYNNLRQPRLPYEKEGVLNIPVSASPGIRFPLFWLAVKNFPLPLIIAEARRTLRRDGQVNFYFHPWEFVDLSEYRGLPWYVRRHSGKGMIDRVTRLMRALKKTASFTTFEKWTASRSLSSTHT